MESGKGEGSVEEDDEDSQKGGGIAEVVWIFLQSRCSVGAALLRGDMGGYPPHGPGPRGFPVPVCAEIDRESPVAAYISAVGLHLGRGGKGRFGV